MINYSAEKRLFEATLIDMFSKAEFFNVKLQTLSTIKVIQNLVSQSSRYCLKMKRKGLRKLNIKYPLLNTCDNIIL